MTRISPPVDIHPPHQVSHPILYKVGTVLVLLVVLLLLAWQPLLRGQIPWRGDGLLHFYRLAQLERAVHSGVLYPRWSPDLGYGYGFPLFNYYAPFSYLVVLPLRLIGLPLTTSLQVSYALALLVLGVGVFLWARALWHDWSAAITAVLAAVYTPYILYNTYHRAALAELWGLAWLAMTLWAVHKAASQRTVAQSSPFSTASSLAAFKTSLQPLLTAAICYALLLLSHNITALIGTPLILGYALFLLWVKPSPAPYSSAVRPLLLFGSILLGLGLAAFFWLPAFFEKDAVQIENLTGSSNFAYTNHFLSPAELFAWPQTADPSQVNPSIPRSLSWPVIILALCAWLPCTSLQMAAESTESQNSRRSCKQYRLIFTLVALICVLMMLPMSQPIWDAVPLLAFVQFPWRFLGPATMSLALLAALGVLQLVRILSIHFSLFSSFLIVSFSFFTLLYALPWLFPSSSPPLPTQITPVDTIRFEAETGWLGTTAAADYLPRTVSELPTAYALLPQYESIPVDGYITRLDMSLLPDTFIVTDYQEQFTTTTFSYRSQEPATAVFAWYAFPGWQATLDGMPLETGVQEPHGFLTAVLPAGNHTFRLAFGSTPLRTGANLLSLLSLFFLLALTGYAVVSTAKEHPASVTQRLEQRQIIYFIVLSLPVLLLFILKTGYLDRANTFFRRAAFDGQQVAGVGMPTHINFGDELMLLGADLPVEPVPADQPVSITLFWQALPPVDAEYSVSVQVVAVNGRRYGQGDSFHPAGLPVPRWQAHEYGRDLHTIDILPGTPPGMYQLVAFVYNIATGQRLDVLNEAGVPLSNQYTLGALIIGTPTRYPDPDVLTVSHRTTEAGTAPKLAADVQLLGFDQPLSTPTVGDILPLTLYWYTPQTPTDDYEAALWVSCADQGVVARLPADGRFAPNTSWQAGQVQRADYDLPLRPLAANGRPLMSTSCTLYLRLASATESASLALETFPVTAPAHVFDLPANATPIAQGLADLVTLAAYDLEQTTLFTGDTVTLTLYWQPEQVMRTSYTVFVQMLDANGRILTQQDQFPANGARPTTGWVPGEIVRDMYTLTIPAGSSAGLYQIVVGLYDAHSGSRLPRRDQTGDAITLAPTIEVKTGE